MFMQKMYSLTKFAVLENYKGLYKEEGLIEYIIDDFPGKHLDSKFKSDNAIYNPLEDTKELYMELNKIDPNDFDSIINFVNIYGLPTGANIEAGNKEIKVIHRMKMQEFNNKLEPLKQIISIWQAIKENNKEDLEKHKKDFQLLATMNQIHDYIAYEDFEEVAEKISDKNLTHPIVSEEFKVWISVKEQDLRTIAKAYITQLLNEHASGETKTTLMNLAAERNGKTIYKKDIVEAISFKDLFEVAYFQVRKAILENDIKICEHCGFPFEVTHERQRFCPPRFGRKRSTCENTYNQKLKRQRKKEKDNT
jgi:hypothetical protein